MLGVSNQDRPAANIEREIGCAARRQLGLTLLWAVLVVVNVFPSVHRKFSRQPTTEIFVGFRLAGPFLTSFSGNGGAKFSKKLNFF
jgi:hypothetical protein